MSNSLAALTLCLLAVVLVNECRQVDSSLYAVPKIRTIQTDSNKCVYWTEKRAENFSACPNSCLGYNKTVIRQNKGPNAIEETLYLYCRIAEKLRPNLAPIKILKGFVSDSGTSSLP